MVLEEAGREEAGVGAAEGGVGANVAVGFVRVFSNMLGLLYTSAVQTK